MDNRRNFIKMLTGAGLASTLPSFVALNASSFITPPKEKIWASLIHLSFNMWEDHDRLKDSENPQLRVRFWNDELNLSESLWNDSLDRMIANGMNMVVIDLGDAIKYDSHPEIAVKNAWTTSRLKTELARIRKMGLEPIPKLNFSAGHDQWLRDYSRMVSTPTYYKVCGELISEVIELFNKPRFFHLGYDEEVAENQRFLNVAIVRQGEQWWKDFYFFVKEVEKGGARPWIWSDFMWHNYDEFMKKMPKTVLQSNWFYENEFDINHPDFVKRKVNVVKAFADLEKAGYDQIPCGGYFEIRSGVWTDKNFMKLVQHCNEIIADKRLLGYMHTSWRPTREPSRPEIMKGLDLIGDARKWYIANHKQSSP